MTSVTGSSYKSICRATHIADGNSSGYQESSTSDLSDTDSLSCSHSSPHRWRGNASADHRVSNSTSDSLSSSKPDHLSKEVNLTRRREAPSSGKTVVEEADHSSSGRKAKGADHSSGNDDKRVDRRRSYLPPSRKVVRSASRRGADHSPVQQVGC